MPSSSLRNQGDRSDAPPQVGCLPRTQLETSSNGTPGGSSCPVRSSTCKEEAPPMRSQPLPGEASRRRAEDQFKTTKKVNSETKANTPSRQAEAEKTARLRALRLAKEGAARQALNKLGVKWEPTEAERAYNEGRSTQVPVNPAVRVRGRFSRQLRYGDTELVLER